MDGAVKRLRIVFARQPMERPSDLCFVYAMWMGATGAMVPSTSERVVGSELWTWQADQPCCTSA